MAVLLFCAQGRVFLCKKKVLAILGAVWYNLPYDWKRLRFFMIIRIGKEKSAYNFRNRQGLPEGEENDAEYQENTPDDEACPV